MSQFQSLSKVPCYFFLSVLDLTKTRRPASTGIFFSPNYKNFDQLLQTVKNKTTVLILIFRLFTNNNSTTDFWTLCKKVSWVSVEKISSHSAEKFRRGTLQSISNFGYRKVSCFGGLCHGFLSILFCLTVPRNFVGIPSMFQKSWGIEKFYA